MTNMQFYYSFYYGYQQEHKSKSTFAARTSLLWHHLLQTYGSRNIKSMTSHDIDAIYARLEGAGFAPNTVYGMYAALSSFYGLALEKGLIASSPLTDARVIKPVLRDKAPASPAAGLAASPATA